MKLLTILSASTLFAISSIAGPVNPDTEFPGFDFHRMLDEVCILGSMQDVFNSEGDAWVLSAGLSSTMRIKLLHDCTAYINYSLGLKTEKMAPRAVAVIPKGFHLTNHGKSFQDNEGIITYPLSEAPRLLAIQRRAEREGSTLTSTGDIDRPARWTYLSPIPGRVWTIRDNDGVLHYFPDELDRVDLETREYQFQLPNGQWMSR